MRNLTPFAALAAALLATPGLAQSVEPSTRIAVAYADLNLSSPAGIATLDRRIHAAIVSACGPVSDADPAGKNRARDCRVRLAGEVAAQRDHVLAAAAAPTRLAARQ